MKRVSHFSNKLTPSAILHTLLPNFAASLSPAVHAAFADFIADTYLHALPISVLDGTLHPLPRTASNSSFQSTLNDLDSIISPRTSLYLLLRGKELMVAITYVPFLAEKSERKWFVEHRHELVTQLAESISRSCWCVKRGVRLRMRGRGRSVRKRV
jgi:twinfilin-like protein